MDQPSYRHRVAVELTKQVVSESNGLASCIRRRSVSAATRPVAFLTCLSPPAHDVILPLTSGVNIAGRSPSKSDFNDPARLSGLLEGVQWRIRCQPPNDVVLLEDLSTNGSFVLCGSEATQSATEFFALRQEHPEHFVVPYQPYELALRHGCVLANIYAAFVLVIP